MEKPTKRITTCFNPKTEKSSIDGIDSVRSFTPYSLYPSFQMQELFYTDDYPLSLATRHKDQAYDINLPEKAMRFLKIRMPTKAEMTTDLIRAGESVPDNWHRFNLHRTDTIDYLYILSGQVTCVIDDESVELSQGDFLVQVGAEHTWINDNDEPCYLLCIMMGIKCHENAKKTTLADQAVADLNANRIESLTLAEFNQQFSDDA